MKQTFYLLLAFLSFSCKSQENHNLLIKEIDFKIHKKILLKTEDNYPNVETAFYGFLKNDSSSFSFVASNIQLLLKFNNEGDLIYKFGKRYLDKDFQLPNFTPVGFDYFGDTTFILYPNKCIYKVHQNQILEKISLQIPSDFIISRSNVFYYVPSIRQFILSCGKDYDNMKQFFSKNSPISFFDTKGKFLKSIGTYPKEYIQNGKYFHSSLTTMKGFMEQNNIYLLFDNFSKIYQYDLSGKLIRIIHLPESKYRNNTFKYNIKELDEMSPKEKKEHKNDAYIGGWAKVENQDVFFYSFYSHQKKKIILCKYDLLRNIFLETTLPPIASFINLFPRTYTKDKVYFLSLNSQSDDVYIYELQMD
ncbi:MAG: hypothetical protein OHK0045_25630 [Raineya sp.]